MKKVAPIFMFLLFSFCLFSNPLFWNNKTSLYDHLVEVNKEWLKISADDFLCQDMLFKNDKERIQKHLQLVEKHLRQHPPSGLNPNQLKNRNAALDILNNYWKAGIFPKNTFHQTRQPYFIDRFGTTCAVGYLALQTGESKLVNRISKEMNYGYVAELKDNYPELLDWAQKYGFTADELAWIQPTYQPLNQTWNAVGNGGGFDGKINVMKAINDELLYMAGEFTEIDGVSANSIIVWDGYGWQALGEGVTGVIHDIDIVGNSNNHTVYICGDFYVNGKPEIVNIAFWYNGEWHGYKTSNMTGSVYAIRKFGALYIGGNFEIEDEDGNIIENLAYIKYNDSILLNKEGVFSVNGPVRDFETNGNNLLVAGNFTQTATFTNDTSVNHINTKYLAYWNNNWIAGFDHTLAPITNTKIISGNLYVGADTSPGGAGVFSVGLWEGIYLGYKLIDTQTGFVHGILNFNDLIIYYGNIYHLPVLGTISKGIYVVSPSQYRQAAKFNAPVTAAESFQDQIYFAGEFTSVQGQEFPGLVSTPFDGLVSTEEIIPKNNINIYSSASQIHIQYEALDENAELSIYNLSGQLVKQIKISHGSADIRISTQDWASGMYVFQILGKETQQSGKLAVF